MNRPDETCLTCADEAVPGVVVALLDGELATVRPYPVQGGGPAGEREVSVALVDAATGDTVLVHAGEAIAVVPSPPPTASLYPFLYPEASDDRDAVLAELSRSAEAKAAEIAALRQEIIESATDRLLACAEAIAAAVARGGRLFTFGNGGSSVDAQQVATAFLHPAYGRPVPALSLTHDGALVTALSNDAGFEIVFARQLAAFGRVEDVAFGLSTSGGSANVLRGFAEANRIGMLTVGLAGYGGGAMAEAATIDFLFAIGSASVHRIQEAQTTLYHLLWELTQRALSR